MSDKKLPVIELFGPTIQGEGNLAGQRSHFVRLGGCGYRCTWCDSMHAVEPEEVKRNATYMTSIEIVQALDDLTAAGPSEWITFSGGDPTMHDLGDMIRVLQEGGQKVAIETQGQFFKTYMQYCDLITISPKAPSSGMDGKINFRTLNDITTNTQCILKVVVFDKDDLEWARHIHQSYPDIPFYVSIGTPREDDNPRLGICADYADVCEWTLTMPDMADVIILPQLHVLAWGHQKEK